MTRSVRMLLVGAAITVVALLALAWIAGRYRDMSPSRTVIDVPTPDSTAQVPGGTSASSDTAALRDVDAFVATRRAVRAFLDAHPQEADNAVEQSKGKEREREMKFAPMHIGFLFGLLTTRREALETNGLSFERYEEIRTAWRESKEGRAVPGALGEALGARSGDLDAADLGPWERLDDVTPK